MSLDSLMCKYLQQKYNFYELKIMQIIFALKSFAFLTYILGFILITCLTLCYGLSCPPMVWDYRLTIMKHDLSLSTLQYKNLHCFSSYYYYNSNRYLREFVSSLNVTYARQRTVEKLEIGAMFIKHNSRNHWCLQIENKSYE